MATSATLATAAAAVGALYFTNRSLQATQLQVAQNGQQFALSEQGQFTDRYAKSVEQLGSDRIDVRLGSIYALSRLADDSPRDALTIHSVLAAYVRDGIPCPGAPVVPGNVALPTDIAAAIDILTHRSVGSKRPWADLEKVCLAHRDLTGARLASLDLSRANLQDVLMEGARLAGVILRDARLAGGHFARSDWPDSSAVEADLHHADLRAAWLVRADFSGARLDSADLTSINHPRPEVGPAVPDGPYSAVPVVRLRGTSGTILSGASLVDAKLIDARLNGAQFTGAALTRADFSRADLTGAVFAGQPQYGQRKAELSGAKFVGATLIGADLSGLDLRGVDFGHADLRAANLDGANLKGANLTGALR